MSHILHSQSNRLTDSSIAPLLSRSSAVAMNLAFVSGDFWAVLADRVVFGTVFQPLYFVAFAVIVMGLVVFHLAGTHLLSEIIVVSHNGAEDIATLNSSHNLSARGRHIASVGGKDSPSSNEDHLQFA